MPSGRQEGTLAPKPISLTWNVPVVSSRPEWPSA